MHPFSFTSTSISVISYGECRDFLKILYVNVVGEERYEHLKMECPGHDQMNQKMACTERMTNDCH